jgi:hypothetical protein
MKKLIPIIIALITISFSYSQEWELFLTDSEGIEIYTRPHTESTAWFKTTPKQIPTKINKTIEGYTIQLVQFDCTSKKMGVLANYEYDKEGSLVNSYEYETYEVEMKYTPPETIGELMVNTFCKKDKIDALLGGINKSEGSETGSEGNNDRAGDKGQLDGDPYAPSYFGGQGSGSGSVGYVLNGRGGATYKTLKQDCNESGMVIVRIVVNQNGNVVEASPGVKGTTNTAQCLLEPAKKIAMSHKWPSDSKAPTRQIGFVSVNFNL